MTQSTASVAAEHLPSASYNQNRSRIRGLIGACSGNLVEWYDFFAYAYTAIYFASAFFPSGNQTSQLLATAGVFAVGFFMRPLGGWLFGWIADTRGRKISMIIAVFMMCTGSLVIALLPTYQTIGVAAPILLVVARLLQGLSVGAEYGTGATYISEVATAGRRGFYGSFQYFTIIAGQLLALLTVVALQHTLSPEDLKAWGWRIPFFIGALSAVVVVYLRRSMTETASQKDMHRKEAGSISGLLAHKRAVLLVLAFTAGGSLYFYTFTTYMQKFLVVSAGMSPETVSIIMTTRSGLLHGVSAPVRNAGRPDRRQGPYAAVLGSRRPAGGPDPLRAEVRDQPVCRIRTGRVRPCHRVVLHADLGHL